MSLQQFTYCTGSAASRTIQTGQGMKGAYREKPHHFPV